MAVIAATPNGVGWIWMTLKASWRALMTQVTRTFVGNLAPHSSVARELEPTSNEPGAWPSPQPDEGTTLLRGARVAERRFLFGTNVEADGHSMSH